MPPHYRLKQLGELVSGAGMRYLSKYLLLEDPRRNEMVLNALEQSGVEISKHAVDDQLALVVRVARAHLAPYIAAYSRPDSLADFTEAIQGDPSLPHWAAGLSGSAFFELFWRLVQARGQWWACPAPPFDPKDQSPVAAEVQAFVAAVPGFYAYEWLESEATTVSNFHACFLPFLVIIGA